MTPDDWILVAENIGWIVVVLCLAGLLLYLLEAM